MIPICILLKSQRLKEHPLIQINLPPIIIPTNRIADSHPFLAGVNSRSHSEKESNKNGKWQRMNTTCRGEEERDTENLNGIACIGPAADERQPVVEPAVASKLEGRLKVMAIFI